ncbi:DUF1353 domain-containing protein [Aeromonas salmonicida]|nr:DUF1353 domain-containing protein [Aeromonas salmonicida]EKP0245715.1 DUF1353 domain-containing protein [Aeromonas salmonicida]EKP0258452.1 DUF1353 domain-containing protein [Aeromonas salmonicida]EKP0284547.1 DUF1353 domain-containing protein [Aeromonas salmonicida]
MLKYKTLAPMLFELLEPHTFTVNGIEYTVPAGFKTDGGTIPRALWAITSPTEYLDQYLVHDYLYTVGSQKCITRQSADALLCDSLIEAGMSTPLAYTVYITVRMFGGSHYVPH